MWWDCLWGASCGCNQVSLMPREELLGGWSSRRLLIVLSVCRI